MNSIWTIKMMNRAVVNVTITIPQRTITKKGTTKMKEFEWIDECQRAFEELKAYLTFPPLLNPSKFDEELSLYLVVSPMVICSVLIQKEDCVQLPVCYTNWALRRAGERYPPMKKLAFTLITAAIKLRPYFEVHTIVVQTNKPLSPSFSWLRYRIYDEQGRRLGGSPMEGLNRWIIQRTCWRDQSSPIISWRGRYRMRHPTPILDDQ